MDEDRIVDAAAQAFAVTASEVKGVESKLKDKNKEEETNTVENKTNLKGSSLFDNK